MTNNKIIEIYDDIFPEFLVNTIENDILKEANLEFYYTPNITKAKNSDEYMPGFGIEIFSKILNRTAFHNHYFLFSELIYRLGQKRNFLVTDIQQIRSFIHLPTNNPGPDIVHTDQEEPHWVCLYYVNDSDGDTILFEDDGKIEIQRVSPKKGRVLFFDGSLKHCSSRPVKNTRCIINCNFHASFY